MRGKENTKGIFPGDPDSDVGGVRKSEAAWPVKGGKRENQKYITHFQGGPEHRIARETNSEQLHKLTVSSSAGTTMRVGSQGQGKKNAKDARGDWPANWASTLHGKTNCVHNGGVS